MLDPKHLENTQFYSAVFVSTIYHNSSKEMIVLLKEKDLRSIDYIRKYWLSSEKDKYGLELGYQYFSNKDNNYLKHRINIAPVEIKLIRLLYDNAIYNIKLKTELRKFIMMSHYNIDNMDKDEATWFMSIILGSLE